MSARPPRSSPPPSAAAPADPVAKDKEPASIVDRFAGGRQYALTFNLPQSATQIATSFRNVLIAAGGANPDARFEILNPKSVPGSSSDAESTELTLRTNLEPDVAQAQLAKLTTNLRNDRSLLFERSETFGSTVASETQSLAIIATVASWLIIARLPLGPVQVVRLRPGGDHRRRPRRPDHPRRGGRHLPAVDDPRRQPGLLLEPFKIDLPMIAAFLTLIGFSVNDTIVIFDRIRELKGKSPHLTGQMINDALNQTLSRTILTSLTAWLVVVILYLFGGEGLHGFAFSLVVGFLSGTYSTIYIASPILIDWDRSAARVPASVARGSW